MSEMADKYKIDGQKLLYHGDRVESWLAARTWEKAKKIYPIYLEVSPFGACNHRCTFCGVKSLGYKNVSIKPDVFLERLKEMGNLGVRSIMYAGEGEPLLHPDIAEIVSATKEAGIDVAFTTNGVFLEKIFPVLEHISWIKVSLNAGSEKTHVKIHRAKEGDFSKVLRNIAKAVMIKRENNYKCAIGAQMVVIPLNSREIRDLAYKVSATGANYLVIKPYSPHPLEGDGAMKAEELGYDALGFSVDLEWIEYKVSKKNFKVIIRHDAFKSVVDEERPYNRCLSVPFFWGYITATGDVYSCSVFLGDERFKLGNINEQTFQGIWEGEKRRKCWEMMKSFSASACRKGCRMDACNRFLSFVRKNGLPVPEECTGKKIPHINFI